MQSLFKQGDLLGGYVSNTARTPNKANKPTKSHKPPKPRQPSLLKQSEQPEDPATASSERALCQRCGLYKTTTNPFLTPQPDPTWNGSLLLVGEGPGGEEERTGRFFVGKAGQLLRQSLVEAGFREEDYAFWNAVRCRPPNNRAPTTEEWRCCRPFLLWVLQNWNPKVVLGLGATAGKALLNDGGVSVTTTRGRIFPPPPLS